MVKQLSGQAQHTLMRRAEGIKLQVTTAEINALVTLENAQEWKSKNDKSMFCWDLMGISCEGAKADSYVLRLENKFIKLLAKAEV